MDKIQNGRLQDWRLSQKTRKESHKRLKCGTHVPWVIPKHPRRGAQNNLKQGVSYRQNLKWPSTVLAITQKTTKEPHKSAKFGTYVPQVILKHPRRGAKNNLKQEEN